MMRHNTKTDKAIIMLAFRQLPIERSKATKKIMTSLPKNTSCFNLLEKRRADGVIRVGRTTASTSFSNVPLHCWNRNMTTIPAPSTIPITFVYSDGEEVVVQAEIGKNLLEVSQANGIDLEGACGGELACATCHLVFEQEVYDTLPKKLEEEEDMLDLAYGLTDTSRLGCQIKVTNDLAEARVRVPEDGI